jgi:hypothetical protein
MKEKTIFWNELSEEQKLVFLEENEEYLTWADGTQISVNELSRFMLIFNGQFWSLTLKDEDFYIENVIFDDMRTKSDISNQVDGKVICFDDYNFDFGYLYVFFDPSTDELCAGCGFNAGISKDYSINYDYDFSVDENLEALYEHIIEENMQ